MCDCRSPPLNEQINRVTHYDGYIYMDADNTFKLTSQKDWDGTATYFQSSDEHGFSMYYKPQVGFVGDPMPFYDPVAKDFKVMYLQDYRPNPEATYHPIFGVATKDGATYESLGELIPCGGRDEQDAAIGTGGTIYNPVDKLYYTFYTGNKFKPSSDQNAQVVMVATSPDFKTWTKNRTFYLKGDTYGYDKNDFRDPFLFQTEDGVYHMLIATRKNGKGHIAEFTSTDLKEWASAGTFMTMMWDRFYECPDVFNKRAFMPYGGIKMAEQACTTYGYQPSEKLHEIFTKYTRTHNQAVFDAYTPEMKKARHSHIVTGLPDTYGRGRIVGDYRRVALYGIDYLIKAKQNDFANCGDGTMTEEVVRQREEISMQISALKGMKEMAAAYGFDISQPAANAKEAVQWLYFGYLAAIKTQNGAAMSVGRVSTFLDIYIQRDLDNGTLTESEAQELIDHMVMKFRMVKFARIPSYNQLFSGDPVWATLEVGGIGMDGRSMVTKNDFRFLHTLENMGPAPEPNLTVLYSKRLPEAFRKYAAKISVTTSSIQYENDDLMRPDYGDDYGIACCVSPMKIGKQMQYFGARANLAKCLLYAINGGRDEKSGVQVAPRFEPITSEYLDYDEVMKKYDVMMDWLAHLYVGTLNMIHYMHDKYYYEAAEMALIDTDVRRTFATGIAGFSHVVDSLSAIKYAKVKVIRDEEGMAVDFETTGDFPRYGITFEVILFVSFLLL